MVGAKVPTMEDPVEKAVVGGVKWLHWVFVIHIGPYKQEVIKRLQWELDFAKVTERGGIMYNELEVREERGRCQLPKSLVIVEKVKILLLEIWKQALKSQVRGNAVRLPYAGVDWRGRRYFENLQAYKNNSYWKISISLACLFLGIKKHLAKSIQLFYILLCNQDMTLSCGRRVKIYFSYSFTLSGEKATFQCALKTRYSLWLLQNNFSCKAKTHFLVKLFF